MATHSSILAWRILWKEKSGGLWFIGSQRVGHDSSDLALSTPAPQAGSLLLSHQGTPGVGIQCAYGVS